MDLLNPNVVLRIGFQERKFLGFVSQAGYET